MDGYGYAVAADKGGAIKGHKIDVFFPSTSDAYRWGVKKGKGPYCRLIRFFNRG